MEERRQVTGRNPRQKAGVEEASRVRKEQGRRGTIFPAPSPQPQEQQEQTGCRKQNQDLQGYYQCNDDLCKFRLGPSRV